MQRLLWIVGPILVLQGWSTKADASAPATLAPGFKRLEFDHGPLHLDAHPESIKRTGEIVVGESRMSHCATRIIGRTPSLTFTVTASVVANLHLTGKTERYRDIGTSIVRGDQAWCVNGTDLTMTWTPGNYQLYFADAAECRGNERCPEGDIPAGTFRAEFTDLSPRTETLAQDFAQNPLTLEEVLFDASQGMRNADGFLGEGAYKDGRNRYAPESAALTLALAAPQARLRVVLDWGQVEDILVTDANGRATRSRRMAGDGSLSVELADLPAGKLEIRPVIAGGYQPPAVSGLLRFSVSVSDPTLPWRRSLADIVPVQAFERVIPEPITVRVDTAGKRAFVDKCGNKDPEGRPFGFRAVPDLILDVRQPIEGSWIEVRPRKLVYFLVGPFGPNGERLPDTRSGCERGFASLDLGRYALYINSPGVPLAAPATILMGNKTTKATPLLRVGEPVADAPIAAREVDEYYPRLEQQKIGLDMARQLFADVPLVVFVYPRFDLDKASAKRTGREATAYPTTDEPLLLLSMGGGSYGRSPTVMGVDGMRYEVAEKYLALTPSGPIQFPAKPRLPEPSLDDLRGLATPADLKEIEAYDAAVKRHGDCEDRRLGGQRPSYVVIEQTSGGSSRTSEHHTDAQLDAAWAACGGKALDTKNAQLIKRLTANVETRFADALVPIRARFAAPSP